MKQVWLLKHPTKGYWAGGEEDQGENFTHHVNPAVQFVREEDAKAANASLYFLPLTPVPVSVADFGGEEPPNEIDLRSGSPSARGDDDKSAA